MKYKHSIVLITCVAMILVFTACSSKSVIKTYPPEATVYFSESEFGKEETNLGPSPALIEGRPFRTYYIRAEKNGCEASKMIKAKEMDAERAALGCCACGVPGLLGAGLVLPDEIELRLVCPDETTQQIQEIKEQDTKEDIKQDIPTDTEKP